MICVELKPVSGFSAFWTVGGLSSCSFRLAGHPVGLPASALASGRRFAFPSAMSTRSATAWTGPSGTRRRRGRAGRRSIPASFRRDSILSMSSGMSTSRKGRSLASTSTQRSVSLRHDGLAAERVRLVADPQIVGRCNDAVDAPGLRGSFPSPPNQHPPRARCAGKEVMPRTSPDGHQMRNRVCQSSDTCWTGRAIRSSGQAAVGERARVSQPVRD